MTQNTTLLLVNLTFKVVREAKSLRPHSNSSQQNKGIHLSPLPRFPPHRHGFADGSRIQMIEMSGTKNSLQRTHCEVQLISLSQGPQPVQAAALVVILQELDEAWRTNGQQKSQVIAQSIQNSTGKEKGF